MVGSYGFPLTCVGCGERSTIAGGALNEGITMIYFLALIPATMLTIAGYFVMYLAVRSEGGWRAFGRYLSFWAFTLAALVILAAIFAAAHGRHHHHWQGEPGFYHAPMARPPGAAPPAAPNPAAPPAGGAPPPSQ